MGYCFNMKSSMDEENLKEKISEDEKRTITSKCDEALKWLDGNQLAEVEEFKDKQKEVGCLTEIPTACPREQATLVPQLKKWIKFFVVNYEPKTIYISSDTLMKAFLKNTFS